VSGNIFPLAQGSGFPSTRMIVIAERRGGGPPLRVSESHLRPGFCSQRASSARIAAQRFPTRGLRAVLALAVAVLSFALLASWSPAARADEAGLPPAGPSDATGPPPTDGGSGGAPGPTDGGATAQPPSGPPAPPPSDPPAPPPNDPGAQAPTDAQPGPPAQPVNPQPQDTTPADAGADSSKKSSPLKSSGGSPDATNGNPTPVAASPTPLPATDNAPDEMWVDQWSTFPFMDSGGTGAARIALGAASARIGTLTIFRGSRATRLEASARQNGETAKASPLGGGAATPGGPGGPGLGSLLDLFSGSGGGATLMFYGLLGILMVTLLPAPGRARAFRLPVVTWRPSEYVPPIEQPG
jgi:hypothetical protein